MTDVIICIVAVTSILPSASRGRSRASVKSSANRLSGKRTERAPKTGQLNLRANGAIVELTLQRRPKNSTSTPPGHSNDETLLQRSANAKRGPRSDRNQLSHDPFSHSQQFISEFSTAEHYQLIELAMAGKEEALTHLLRRHIRAWEPIFIEALSQATNLREPIVAKNVRSR